MYEDDAFVRFVRGNHDFDLARPGVQRALARPGVQRALAGRLSATGTDRLAFTNGYRHYHGVHIQHGFHFRPENNPVDPEHFIHRGPGPEGTDHLERVLGTDFLLWFFNDLEREFPFVDIVKPHLDVLLDGVRHGWVGGREIARLARFLARRGVPLKAVVDAALDDGRPPRR